MARILMIDAELPARRDMAPSLSGCGHSVLEANVGHAGRRQMAGIPVEVMTAELFNQGEEGLRTIIKGGRQSPGDAIVATSLGCTNAPVYVKRAKQLGASDGLVKPFTAEQLMAGVDQWLLRAAGEAVQGKRADRGQPVSEAELRA